MEVSAPSVMDSYQGTVRRTAAIMAVITTIGVIGTSVAKGPLFGAGFLMGAVLSGLSFWRWMKVVESLGTGEKRGTSTMRWVLRFAFLALMAYVIVKFLEVTPAAVFLGLLVSAASVIIAIIYELTYARK